MPTATVDQKREELTSLACSLPHDHLIKPVRWIAVEQRPKALACFVVGRTVLHGHESFLTLVLHEGGIIAIFQGLQKMTSHKALVVCKCFIFPGKPLQKDPLIVDSIVGHGDRRKDVRSLYVSVSDEDLVREIDRMKFDQWETDTISQFNK